MEMYEALRGILENKIQNLVTPEASYPGFPEYGRIIQGYNEQTTRYLPVPHEGIEERILMFSFFITMSYREHWEGDHKDRKLKIILDYDSRRVKIEDCCIYPGSLPLKFKYTDNTRFPVIDMFQAWIDFPKETYDENEFMRRYNDTRRTAVALALHERVGQRSRLRTMMPVELFQEMLPWTDIRVISDDDSDD